MTAAPNLWSMLKTKMAYDSARQEVLAANISHADTPGYTPKDLKPLDFDAMLAGALQPSVTSAKHIAGNQGGGSGLIAAQEQRDIFEVTPVGNGVVLEDQMAMMADNRADYQKNTLVFKKFHDLMKLALGNR